MIYIAADIFSYEQLRKIQPELLKTIENEIRSIPLSQTDAAYARAGSTLLFTLGEEQHLNPSRIADSAYRIFVKLNEYAEELYGFSVLVAVFSEAAARPTIENLLLFMNEENSLWANQKAHHYLSQYFTFQRCNRLWRVLDYEPPTIRSRDRQALPGIRLEAAEAILDAFFQKSESKEAYNGVLLVGETGSGKRAAVREAVSRLLSREDFIRPPRLYTIFKRQSPVHPFINSLDSDFLPRVTDYLFSTEKTIWAEKQPLLDYLLDSSPSPKCLDRLVRDFYIAYCIYFSAYVRYCSAELLPALLICEDVETYHSECLRMLTTLIRDFQHHPCFFPVLLLSADEVPEALLPLSLRKIPLELLDWRSIQLYGGMLYPGLSLPRTICREMAKITSGHTVKVLQYLFLLENEEKIAKRENEYAWVPQRDRSIVFPGNDIELSWRLLKSFDPLSLSVLYAICLSSGLIGRDRLLKFLTSLGCSDEECRQALDNLGQYGFICGADPIIAGSGYLIKKCEILLGSRCQSIRMDFKEFIIRHWREKSYGRLVLLFYFFAKNGLGNLSFEILPQLLKQKLDEGDLKGARIFLDLNDDFYGDRLSRQDLPRLEIILKAARLRCELLAGNRSAAAEAAEDAQLSLSEYPSCSERGVLLLRLAAYYLSISEVSRSVESCKRALIELHEYERQKEEGEAYILLASAMLAEGKSDEAEEYLAISERLLPELSFNALQAAAYSAVVAFIQGKATYALTKIRSGLNMAKSIGRREWELFLLFFQGRVHFYLGEYDSAVLQFSACRAFAEAYDFPTAGKLAFTWLARSYIYKGQPARGAAILKQLSKTAEVLSYLAEACQFIDEHDSALRCLDIAAKRHHYKTPYPGDKVFWHNGYASIESRCLFLERRESLLERYVKILKAYITAHDRESSLNVLREYTQGTNISTLDANSILYLYLYASAQGAGDSVDRLTTLNKALKYLQERAARIDSPEQKNSYTRGSRWNRLLIEEAKRSRLL